VRRQQHADSLQEEKAIGLGRVRDAEGDEADPCRTSRMKQSEMGRDRRGHAQKMKLKKNAPIMGLKV